MRVILWIIRALAILVIARMLLSPFFGRARRPPPPRGPRPPGKDTERQGGELVRDPNCGTYVPKSGAVTTGSGEGTLYFCSVKCRDEYAGKR